ncbi:exodeoxyribonuclease VII large subunit [Sphingomicrobium nitratireducens]|uniref:exodeoxyribonuclease VII large subunit n=1 Tax=Sphingomicrobium nitratireducens TaxID=2964666 RepID=UPI002240015D|nr:exodeoxyribonuclease VII large subunit [Sphingomicrobium nitratireducens]
MSFPEDEAPGLLAKSAAGDNAAPLSVSDLSGALKRTVEDAFGHVRVRGEISGWKRAASGHCYFTLKDENACIDAVLWRGQSQRLAFSPEDGAEVIATGKVTTYPGRSKYQISVTSLELAGEGALMALLEKRKRALAAEGLFASERKKDLPYLPRVIGVVTSPTGAVIRDILHRLEDRFPTHVLVWPVPVQGEAAAPAVASAIRGFDALPASGGRVPRPDLLIVARGGGSIEDLWAFNEEAVVRAAADCSIPLISAVGHETDVTLIDHAADRRAPTPTAAAEMAVPVRRDLVAFVGDLAQRAGKGLSRRLDRSAERFALAAERLPEPASLVDQREQRVDELTRRLGQGLSGQLFKAGGRLAEWTGRLDAGRLLGKRAREGEARLLELVRRMPRADRYLAARSERLASLWRLADLAHPERPLDRGFARVSAGDGASVTSAEAARRAVEVTLHFRDGSVDARTDGAASAAKAPVAPRGRRPYRTPSAPQPGLFDDPGAQGDD